MSNVVRYFNDGEPGRIVEHRDIQWRSTGEGKLNRERVIKRRWLTIERYKNGSWQKESEIGDYVEPKNAPHK